MEWTVFQPRILSCALLSPVHVSSPGPTLWLFTTVEIVWKPITAGWLERWASAEKSQSELAPPTLALLTTAPPTTACFLLDEVLPEKDKLNVLRHIVTLIMSHAESDRAYLSLQILSIYNVKIHLFGDTFSLTNTENYWKRAFLITHIPFIRTVQNWSILKSTHNGVCMLKNFYTEEFFW